MLDNKLQVSFCLRRGVANVDVIHNRVGHAPANRVTEQRVRVVRRVRYGARWSAVSAGDGESGHFCSAMYNTPTSAAMRLCALDLDQLSRIHAWSFSQTGRRG